MESRKNFGCTFDKRLTLAFGFEVDGASSSEDARLSLNSGSDSFSDDSIIFRFFFFRSFAGFRAFFAGFASIFYKVFLVVLTLFTVDFLFCFRFQRVEFSVILFQLKKSHF